jgi:hypothetical protein
MRIYFVNLEVVLGILRIGAWVVKSWNRQSLLNATLTDTTQKKPAASKSDTHETSRRITEKLGALSVAVCGVGAAD